ncbi:MAG: hypothetical protein ABI910_22365 [Gemmatimonadota bacterium]
MAHKSGAPERLSAEGEVKAATGPAHLREIVFHHIKTSGYRTIHVDGVHGGLSPNGLIHFSVYSERFPIPRETVFPIDAAGAVGSEIVERRDTKGGVVREFEAGLVMDIRTTRAVHKWMGEQIALHEKMTAEIGAGSQGSK